MSCGRDPTDEPSFPPIEPAAALCVRCKLLSPTILIRSTSYCSECFLDVIRTRFLSGLSSARDRARKGSAREVQERKPRAASTRSSVLLAFSGGASSQALLNLIRTSFPVVHAKQNARFTPPPTFQKFEVVYVDESGVPGYGGVDRTEEVRQIVESTGFAFVGIKLEDAFDEVSVPPATSSCSQPSTPLSSLQSFLFGHTATSRTSLHASLLQSLLRRTAVARGHEILFTGESASRVAVKVLGGMSEGRGWGMGEEVGSAFEVDFEAEGISLFHSRPLSLCLDKEIVLYNRLSNLQSLTMVTPATGVGAKQAGVEALCEEFVNGLEAAFPATVSTIIRTAGKLGLRSSHELAREGVEDPAARSGGECPLCGLPSQAGGSEWRRANTISSLVDSRALAAGNDTAEPTSHPTDPAPAALLCYGCLIIFEEQQSAKRPSAARSIAGEAGLVTPVVLLPPYALEVARRRGQMREQIDEFLLE